MNSKEFCPVCLSSRIRVFVKRTQVPIHQNFLMDSREKAKSIDRGDLTLTVCEECGFIFNSTFLSSKMQYGKFYDNTQNYSSYFDDYQNDQVSKLVINNKIKNNKIVEVGCGRGTFLHKLVNVKEWNNVGFGFDPSYVGPNSDLEGRLQFRKQNFNSSCTDIKADTVICRHVIEHIKDPILLLLDIKNALINSKKTKIFFETPNVEWILKNHVIWDFFYEHCSHFSEFSIISLFQRAGYDIKNIEKIFNGQYLWLEAFLENQPSTVSKKPGDIPILASKFAEHEKSLIKKWKNKILDLSHNGKVAIWGAGAKGATFANLVDPENCLIDCIIDLNPNKQGKYLVGTGHSIIHYEKIKEKNIKSAIVMNPNYFQEINEILKKANLKIELIQEP